ncbi:hypothetical protein BDZ85DRAFT_284802 [Elsinoe ampelina]|uniref:Uncharacterized protein n=1 Tax=Elsinoe ampelina TaxID=302913 RepID=A0A6A6G266_9PEZI|nr:hypothetical protein BDZ85DRAFT_284802 [Elsinoe ampelina]
MEDEGCPSSKEVLGKYSQEDLASFADQQMPPRDFEGRGADLADLEQRVDKAAEKRNVRRAYIDGGEIPEDGITASEARYDTMRAGLLTQLGLPTTIESDLATSNASVDALQQQKEALEEERNNALTEIKRLLKVERELKEGVKTAKNAAGQAEANMKEANKYRMQTEQSVEKLTKERDDAINAKDAALDQVRDLRREKDELSGKLSQRQSELNRALNHRPLSDPQPYQSPPGVLAMRRERVSDAPRPVHSQIADLRRKLDARRADTAAAGTGGGGGGGAAGGVAGGVASAVAGGVAGGATGRATS